MPDQPQIPEILQMVYGWGKDLFDQIDRDLETMQIGFPEAPGARQAFLDAVKQAQSPEAFGALLQQRQQAVGAQQTMRELGSIGRTAQQ